MSASGVYRPGLLVNGSATKNGWETNRSIRRGAVDDDLVVLGKLVDAEDRDDACAAPALENPLDAAGGVVVLLANVLGVEDGEVGFSRAGSTAG